MEYKRQITIDVPLQKTRLFIREVKNLPIWTHFFKRCISYNGTEGEMETLLGKTLTSIHEEEINTSIRLLICSKFEHRQEQALITIEGGQEQANVTFHLKVPSEIDVEHKEKMLMHLEEELSTLKSYLELRHNG